MAKKHCPHCGASMVEYKRGLTKGLGRCLKILALRGGNNVPVCDLDLNNSEYSAFAKLRLWGVIEKEKSCDDVNGRGGYWSLTDIGWEFVRGEISLPKHVIEYRGNVVETGSEYIHIKEISDGWWFRPRVVEESRPHEETQLYLL